MMKKIGFALWFLVALGLSACSEQAQAPQEITVSGEGKLEQRADGLYLAGSADGVELELTHPPGFQLVLTEDAFMAKSNALRDDLTKLIILKPKADSKLLSANAPYEITKQIVVPVQAK
ncbi:MAG: hypothetical protein CMH60_00765 [Myxococcales bacterium]|nr:hypothetical protein [Myxococcales bacterium]